MTAKARNRQQEGTAIAGWLHFIFMQEAERGRGKGREEGQRGMGREQAGSGVRLPHRSSKSTPRVVLPPAILHFIRSKTPPNSNTNWGPSSQSHEAVGNIFHSIHYKLFLWNNIIGKLLTTSHDKIKKKAKPEKKRTMRDNKLVYCTIPGNLNFFKKRIKIIDLYFM